MVNLSGLASAEVPGKSHIHPNPFWNASKRATRVVATVTIVNPAKMSQNSVTAVQLRLEEYFIAARLSN
jgi:hypothetical protein